MQMLIRLLPDDALCSFGLFLVAPATVAHTTTREIKRAAQALLDKCTATAPAKGGVATNIGALAPIHLSLGVMSRVPLENMT